MKTFIYKISTKLKEEIKDPKGEVVEQIVKRLDFASKIKINTGKFYEIKLEALNKTDADKKIEKISKEILTNPLVEIYKIEDVVELC